MNVCLIVGKHLIPHIFSNSWDSWECSLKLLTLHMARPLRASGTSAQVGILAAETFGMSQSEAELASLLIGRKDMRLRTAEWNVPQRYNQCCWGDFRAFGVTGLKEGILKLRLREIEKCIPLLLLNIQL